MELTTHALGFRVPTQTELDAERLSWSSNNDAGAFASPLKFTTTGLRDRSDGFEKQLSNGRYWSNYVVGTDAVALTFDFSRAYVQSKNRAYGYSIRCIKN